jgi:Lrp/AsnC family leucine-responsive transcriptional regulator
MNRTLDPTDIKILNLLQQDATLELSQIASRVHKSTTPVFRRIRQLQQDGFIKRYVAILDREKIGKPLLAIVQVTLSDHSQAAMIRFVRHVNTLPEVQLCMQLSGVCDFILHIAQPGAQEYHHFLMNQVCSLPEVAHVQTSFVLQEFKFYTPYILEEGLWK